MSEGRATPLTREQWLAECCKLAKIYEDNMTKALDEIERKALALVNEVSDGFHDVASIYDIHTAKALRSALCLAIEQHEAYRQEVSDAVEKAQRMPHSTGLLSLARFITPKPDPLVEALCECGFVFTGEQTAVNLRAALAARGLKIVEDK